MDWKWKCLAVSRQPMICWVILSDTVYFVTQTHYCFPAISGSHGIPTDALLLASPMICGKVSGNTVNEDHVTAAAWQQC